MVAISRADGKKVLCEDAGNDGDFRRFVADRRRPRARYAAARRKLPS
jgi:hypothetical protein